MSSSAPTTPSLVLSQLWFSMAVTENSDLVAAWRYRGKTEGQIYECLRLNVSKQRKKLFIIRKKLLVMSTNKECSNCI